jgi:hypothetical protein
VLLLITIFANIFACKVIELEIKVSDCIEDIIEAITKEPVTNPPTKVEQWIVDGKIFYYFTSDCCDQYNYLYDELCTKLCAPDGGITGEGDGNCPDFTGEIHKTLVWQDSRR